MRKRSRQVEPRAFEELLSAHLDALYHTALRLCGGQRADAEDLLQDAVLRAFEHFESLRDPAAARAWLFTILVRTNLNRIRSRRRRAAFAPFELPALTGHDTIRLRNQAGKVVVVNFWASWCGPCRREMPQLNALARSLDTARVAVIGLNEDVDADAARQFVAELDIRYPIARGGGRLQSRYAYRGLPYTVVLDREHRVATAIYGFGESVEPIRRAVRAELVR